MPKQFVRSTMIFAAAAAIFASAAEASYRVRGSSGGFDDESAAVEGFAAWYANGAYFQGSGIDPNG